LLLGFLLGVQASLATEIHSLDDAGHRRQGWAGLAVGVVAGIGFTVAGLMGFEDAPRALGAAVLLTLLLDLHLSSHGR